MIATQKRKRVSDHVDKESKRLRPVITTANIRAPEIPFDAYKSDKSIILHSSAHPRLDYIAEPVEDNLAHYIAIQDGDSIKFHHAEYNRLLCVPRTAIKDIPRGAISAQRIALGQEFGTKKAKKAIASKTVNAISSTQDDTQAVILEDVAETTGKEEVADLAKTLSVKPIPRPNLAAEIVEDVYPIHTLIPAADMRMLDVKDWQEKAISDTNIEFTHRFPAYRVTAIGKSKDGSRLKALLYVTLLLQFNDALKPGRASYKVPSRDILTSKMSTSEALINSIRKRFSDERNELTKWHRDNLHTHICALTMYVDRFDTDTSNIRDDLKVDSKTVNQYFMELGARISTMTDKERTAAKYSKAQAGTVRMARLKIPLEFPKPRRR